MSNDRDVSSFLSCPLSHYKAKGKTQSRKQARDCPYPKQASPKQGPMLRVQPELQLGLSALMFLAPEALEPEAYLLFF